VQVRPEETPYRLRRIGFAVEGVAVEGVAVEGVPFG